MNSQRRRFVRRAWTCLNSPDLFARRFTGSYSTWSVIHTLAAPPYSMSCWWRSRPQSSLAPERAWSRSSTALGWDRYLIWRKVLCGAPMGWPCCQCRLKLFWWSPVKFSFISFDWIGCIEFCCCTCDCCAGGSNADGCGADCLYFKAINWSSKLIIWSVRSFSFAGQRALYTGISFLKSKRFFSRALMASMRLSSNLIIISARRFSAAVTLPLNLGIRARSCESRW